MSVMHARYVHASAATRLTATPFLPDARHIWNAFEHYLGAELYRRANSTGSKYFANLARNTSYSIGGSTRVSFNKRGK